MQYSRKSKVKINALPLLAALILLAALRVMAAPGVFESDAPLTPENKIDELVFAKLHELNMRPARVCPDTVFVRRIYLDAIGTLPTAAEAEDFIMNRNPDKRRILTDRLLNRQEFADYWSMKWSDLLRIKAEFPINLWPNAAQAYHHWVRDCIEKDVPYDKFAADLLTASGSNFADPRVNFYRALQKKDPATIAQTVALTFMGTRLEKWPAQKRKDFEAFFSNLGYKTTLEWKEEIVYFDSAPTNAPAVPSWPRLATFPDGTTTLIAQNQDPRAVFAAWLTKTNNPWFARNIVNRVWSWLMGRGIINEPDDIRADNPPVNPELLAYLENELVTSGYDLKHIYRLILNSRTYQLSCIPGADDPAAAANFASYPLRRLDAEVLIDAVDQITGTTESYSSAIPEPYTFIPDNVRSIALPDGSITSSFLEMFGRPPRDTGLESERNNRTTAEQRLHWINSSHIQKKLEQSSLLRLQMQANETPRQITTSSYLTVLSRFPTEKELHTAETYFQTPGTPKRSAAIDIAWALLNSPEFLYRH
jgi:hypothetical protein